MENTKLPKLPCLIIVAAPSGAGKTTLCSRLLSDFKKQITLSISTTTRAPRPGEVDGREYHFSSREAFEAKVAAGRFAEWAEVHGSLYGTSKDTLESSFAGGLSVLLDIDVQGAASLRAAYPNQTFSVFVSPPNLEILEKRLRGRGTDSEEVIQKRLRNARTELARASEFSKILINDDIERAYSELKQWLETVLRGPRG